ncbi:MAG: glutamate--tRNA ligase family protein, partial [Pyrinomonadaceae bacterium]
LIFRDEDLDPARSREHFAAAMFEDLRWLGIEWQEGPGEVGGPCGPYEQSRRRDVYLDAWQRLLKGGWIYPCVCSRKDLARSAQAPHEGALAPNDEALYPGTCRPPFGSLLTRAAAPAGVNWRFRVPDGETLSFADLRQGPQAFIAGRDFGDFLVWRRDDVPSYQLAVTVDDWLMRVTEVVRGVDLLKSTARQLLVQRALGYATPAYYHCDLVTDEQGFRLSKRHDALSLRALRDAGVTAAQLLGRLSPG